MSELKDCPFCKSRNVSASEGETGDGRPWKYVECEKCGATAPPKRWNRRPIEDEIQTNYRHATVLLAEAERQRDTALSMGATDGPASPFCQVGQPAGTGHDATPKRSDNPNSSLHLDRRAPQPVDAGGEGDSRCQKCFGTLEILADQSKPWLASSYAPCPDCHPAADRRLSPKAEAGGNAEELANWLDAKYARHGEIEDKQAAALLRKLDRGGEDATAKLLLRDALGSVITVESYLGNTKQGRLSDRITAYLDDAALEPKP